MFRSNLTRKRDTLIVGRVSTGYYKAFKISKCAEDSRALLIVPVFGGMAVLNGLEKSPPTLKLVSSSPAIYVSTNAHCYRSPVLRVLPLPTLGITVHEEPFQNPLITPFHQILKSYKVRPRRSGALILPGCGAICPIQSTYGGAGRRRTIETNIPG